MMKGEKQMKYETLIFMKVLSGLVQQNYYTNDKKAVLLSAWQDACRKKDFHQALELIREISSVNKNKVWAKELMEIEERIGG